MGNYNAKRDYYYHEEDSSKNSIEKPKGRPHLTLIKSDSHLNSKQQHGMKLSGIQLVAISLIIMITLLTAMIVKPKYHKFDLNLIKTKIGIDHGLQK